MYIYPYTGGNFHTSPSFFDIRSKQLVIFSEEPENVVQIYSYSTGEVVLDYVLPKEEIDRIARETGPDMSGTLLILFLLFYSIYTS